MVSCYDLDKSNKFGQMQELTNDNYSEIKLCSIFHIFILNIRPLNLVVIKKNQQLHSRPLYWNNNEAAPANGGFVNKANRKKSTLSGRTGVEMSPSSCEHFP